jgi:hypothetical protein
VAPCSRSPPHPGAVYYSVVADPLLQGGGGGAVSVANGHAPVAAAQQGLVPVFAVPSAAGAAGSHMSTAVSRHMSPIDLD